MQVFGADCNELSFRSASRSDGRLQAAVIFTDVAKRSHPSRLERFQACQVWGGPV